MGRGPGKSGKGRYALIPSYICLKLPKNKQSLKIMPKTRGRDEESFLCVKLINFMRDSTKS